MRRVFVLLAASGFGFGAVVADLPEVLAGDRAFSEESGVKRAGNWSNADAAAKAKADDATRV